MLPLNQLVKVHPVVLFQVIEDYERRNADAKRVIGTLLGSVDKNTIEVTNCFCVPHKEHDDQVEAELSYATDLYELNRKVNPNELIVGWWATGHEVTNHSSIIHEFYSRECSNPVHLTIDTTLHDGHFSIKAYVCIQLGVPGGKSGCMFTPIPVEMVSFETESFGLKLLRKTVGHHHHRSNPIAPTMDMAQIAEAASSLEKNLDLLLQYVDGVINHKIAPDNVIGRELLNLIDSVPNMSSETFVQMFNSHIRENLMLVTLAQLVKNQLQLNEKLTLLSLN